MAHYYAILTGTLPVLLFPSVYYIATQSTVLECLISLHTLLQLIFVSNVAGKRMTESNKNSDKRNATDLKTIMTKINVHESGETLSVTESVEAVDVQCDSFGTRPKEMRISQRLVIRF